MKILAIIIFITGAGLGYWRGYVKGYDLNPQTYMHIRTYLEQQEEVYKLEREVNDLHEQIFYLERGLMPYIKERSDIENIRYGRPVKGAYIDPEQFQARFG
jgi:replicative superfamily II helicase